jgi:Raf kinase inhibitor-like YbhB/YbcL family protein
MKRLGIAALGLLLCSACARPPATEAIVPEETRLLTIRLRSPAFPDGGAIPELYTCDGQDRSPPLAWSGVPEAARALALVCDDPDAPSGPFTHWLLYNIPPSVHELKEGLPAGAHVPLNSGAARQGTNDFGQLGYGGPCPPSGTHHYHFRLYALDTELALAPGANRAQGLGALKGHVLAIGKLMGTYTRRR